MSFSDQIKVPGSVKIPGSSTPGGSSTPSLADILAGTLGVALLFGAVTPPAAGTRCIYGTGTDLVRDVGGKHIWQVGGANALQISAVTGGAGHYLKQTAAGGVLSSGVIALGDLPAISTTNLADWPSGLDVTELGYLNGATSAIQTQLTTNASNISTNATAIAAELVRMQSLTYGGTGVSLAASGGATYVLAQDASHVISARALVAGDIPSLAGSIITSGTVGAAYLGSGTANSSTYLRGDNTWGAAPADGTKLPLAGGTLTGQLIFGTASALDFGTAAGTSPGAGHAYIFGSSGVVYYNSPTNGYHDIRIQDVSQAFIYVKGLVFPTAHTADSTIYQFYRDANGVAVGVPTGKQFSVLAAGATIAYFSAAAAAFTTNVLDASASIRFGTTLYGSTGNQFIGGHYNATTISLTIGGGYDITTGGHIKFTGTGATNYAGNVDVRCKPITRAVSTAWNVCLVSANTSGEVRVLDNARTGDVTTVISLLNGAITAVAGDTAAYVSGAPSTTQMGFTVAGGALVATTGATWPARKVGFIPLLGEQA